MAHTVREQSGSVFTAMRDKDLELYGCLSNLTPDLAMRIWVCKYPDDFPQRGMTDVADPTAVMPKPAQQ